MLTTTLNRIRAHRPCADGWTTLLDYLGKTKADDEPLSFETILAANGLDDALWCLRAMPEHNKHWRLYAVWCARQVQHLMIDARSVAALDVAERHAHGTASDQELAAAWDAAWDAAWAAAWDAAWDAQAARLREVCAQIDALQFDTDEPDYSDEAPLPNNAYADCAAADWWAGRCGK